MRHLSFAVLTVSFAASAWGQLASTISLAATVADASGAAPSWVIRSGYGIYYNPNLTNTYTLATMNPPFSALWRNAGLELQLTGCIASSAFALPAAAFGNIASMTTNNRQIQLAAKSLF